MSVTVRTSLLSSALLLLSGASAQAMYGPQYGYYYPVQFRPMAPVLPHWRPVNAWRAPVHRQVRPMQRRAASPARKLIATGRVKREMNSQFRPDPRFPDGGGYWKPYNGSQDSTGEHSQFRPIEKRTRKSYEERQKEQAAMSGWSSGYAPPVPYYYPPAAPSYWPAW